MTTTKPICLLLASLLLVGCVSGHESASSAAPDRIFAYRTPSSDTATVVILRDTGVWGLAVPAEVIVDGNLTAAQLMATEKVTLHVPAGEHRLGVSPRSGLMGPIYTLGCQRSYTFEAGRTYYLTMGYDAAGEWCILQGPES